MVISEFPSKIFRKSYENSKKMKHRKIRKYKKVFGVPDFSQLGLRYMVIKFYFMAEVHKFRMSKTVCNNRILFGFVILSDEGPLGSDFRKCLIERCQIDLENNWRSFDPEKNDWALFWRLYIICWVIFRLWFIKNHNNGLIRGYKRSAERINPRSIEVSEGQVR